MCTSSWYLSSAQCKTVLSRNVKHILWGVERVSGAFGSKCNITFDVHLEISNFIDIH